MAKSTYEKLPDHEKQQLKRDLRKLFLEDYGFDDRELGRAVVTLDPRSKAEFARKYQLIDADEIDKALKQISGNRRRAKLLKKIWVVTDPIKHSEWMDCIFDADPTEDLPDIMTGMGQSHWKKEHAAMHDDKESAEWDLWKRAKNFFNGKVPEDFFEHGGPSVSEVKALREKMQGKAASLEDPYTVAPIVTVHGRATPDSKHLDGASDVETAKNMAKRNARQNGSLWGVFSAGRLLYTFSGMKLARSAAMDMDQTATLNRWAVKKAMGRVAAKQYTKLSDAAEVTGDDRYKGKGAEVWYVKPAYRRHFGAGIGPAQKDGLVPTFDTLDETHTKIGPVGEKNKDEIFRMMQGEFWSPEGEARGLISKLGLWHTSMSTGDIIVIGKDLFMVEMHGFEKLEG